MNNQNTWHDVEKNPLLCKLYQGLHLLCTYLFEESLDEEDVGNLKGQIIV